VSGRSTATPIIERRHAPCPTACEQAITLLLQGPVKEVAGPALEPDDRDDTEGSRNVRTVSNQYTSQSA
jgi:hypothetical protein